MKASLISLVHHNFHCRENSIFYSGLNMVMLVLRDTKMRTEVRVFLFSNFTRCNCIWLELYSSYKFCDILYLSMVYRWLWWEFCSLFCSGSTTVLEGGITLLSCFLWLQSSLWWVKEIHAMALDLGKIGIYCTGTTFASWMRLNGFCFSFLFLKWYMLLQTPKCFKTSCMLPKFLK